jgi:hypothetical protein
MLNDYRRVIGDLLLSSGLPDRASLISCGPGCTCGYFGLLLPERRYWIDTRGSSGRQICC